VKAKKFKIRLQSPKTTLDEFEKTWKLIAAGKGKSGLEENELVLYFSDLSMISKVLSPERLRLIQTVQEKKPESVNQLAILLGRAQANVHKDVHYLKELGILELKKRRQRGKTESVQPRFTWAGFDIELAKRKAS
jgi:predicted transcriptional regulator